jgi:TetR/AcrR family transcriptional regulator
MRKTRDAEDTRTRVLESAEKLFAEKGFNGTSLAEISQKSGISDGLILYHFKSKNKLYNEVLERISERYGKVIMTLRERNLPLREMMTEAMKTVFSFWKEDKTYNRISLWAYLEGKDEIAVNETVLTAGLANFLSALQSQGEMTKDIHPVVILSMIIGTIHFWIRYKNRFAEILSLNESEKDWDALFLRQFTEMIGKYF